MHVFRSRDIEQLGGMATQQQIIGLTATHSLAMQHIQIIAQDEQQNERVKQYMDILGQLANYVKAYQQRLDEQNQAQQQDPESVAKAQATMMQAQVKAQVTQANACSETADFSAEVHRGRTTQKR